MSGKKQSYCYGTETSSKICGRKDCPCYQNTFERWADAKYLTAWSNKNTLNPDQVSRGSSQLFIFDCPDCGHEIQQKPNCITSKTAVVNKKHSRWCRYCGKKDLCNDLSCNFCK